MILNELYPSEYDKLYKKFGLLRGIGVIIKHYLPSEMITFFFIPYQFNTLNDVRDWQVS